MCVAQEKILVVRMSVAEISRESEKARPGVWGVQCRIENIAQRNRVRRRLREIVRRHQDEVVDGAWIVTIALPRARRASYRALEDEWLRLAKRALVLAP